LKFLERASAAYYEGNPFLSDEDFDKLAAYYNFNNVGYQVTDGVPHLFRMYSLKKCFNIDEAPIAVNKCIKTPKLDGAAIALTYVNGSLALALTRGDGKLGRDITDKLSNSNLVPQQIDLTGSVQITGEIVCPISVENSRNVASGSLNLKDMGEFLERAKMLAFVAYGVQSSVSESLESTWILDMDLLEANGFKTVLSFDSSNYPTDGTVFRINDNSEFAKLGYTQQHPRGAFALKEQKEGVITTLLNVEWQVGKSGVVSPVAILDPVKVGDATVSKATLHNIEYIRDLNLELGCSVEIIRSGEIIPRVVRRVNV
jgi:DNA ligase (NAD+)